MGYFKIFYSVCNIHINIKDFNEIIDNGDHVVCAVSAKLISLENLNYWNVELQEPYFSYVEAHKKKEAN